MIAVLAVLLGGIALEAVGARSFNTYDIETPKDSGAKARTLTRQALEDKIRGG